MSLAAPLFAILPDCLQNKLDTVSKLTRRTSLTPDQRQVAWESFISQSAGLAVLGGDKTWDLLLLQTDPMLLSIMWDFLSLRGRYLCSNMQNCVEIDDWMTSRRFFPTNELYTWKSSELLHHCSECFRQIYCQLCPFLGELLFNQKESC